MIIYCLIDCIVYVCHSFNAFRLHQPPLVSMAPYTTFLWSIHKYKFICDFRQITNSPTVDNQRSYIIATDAQYTYKWIGNVLCRQFAFKNLLNRCGKIWSTLSQIFEPLWMVVVVGFSRILYRSNIQSSFLWLLLLLMFVLCKAVGLI